MGPWRETGKLYIWGLFPQISKMCAVIESSSFSDIVKWKSISRHASKCYMQWDFDSNLLEKQNDSLSVPNPN